MHLHPFTAVALAAFIWENVVGQTSNPCATETTCTSCLYVKDASGITTCGWCRNPNITSEGFCAERTVASMAECTGSYTAADGTNNNLLVLDGSQCTLLNNSNTVIAAVAGSVGGVIFAIIFIYIYYRKRKQKHERLESFRRRELEMHRSRKLKLDKELGMQAGAASSTQRQQLALQMERQSSETKAPPPPAYIEMDAFPPPLEPELVKPARRRFKCMSKGGLRVREAPSSDSAKVGGIKFEVVVTALNVRDNWVQVSANGWAMITSDDGTKVFLKELDEGEEGDDEPQPDIAVG